MHLMISRIEEIGYIITRCEVPLMQTMRDDYLLKDEGWWNGDEKWNAKMNAKVFHSIICFVEPIMLCLIASYVTTKYAWDTLENAIRKNARFRNGNAEAGEGSARTHVLDTPKEECRTLTLNKKDMCCTNYEGNVKKSIQTWKKTLERGLDLCNKSV